MALGERVACLTIDMEPDLHCPERRIRLLDDDSRLRGFIEFLKSAGAPLTVFMTMAYARRYLDRLNAIAAAVPCEFAVHSYSHDAANPTADQEIRRALDEYGALWGSTPAGYRAPNCLIDDRGLERLASAGFRYDSSVVPSFRLDRYGYNHLDASREPFVFSSPSGTLLELPIACHAGIRLPFVFSYVKLLGLTAYRIAAALFPLPNAVVTYFHPYDLYASEIAPNVPGWKRYAHARNGRSGTKLLRNVVELLQRQGYRFALARDVARDLQRCPLPVRRVERAA